MKTKILYSNYNTNTGVSTATIQTKYGIFTGTAKIHPNDKDYSSSFFGCELAELRAGIKSLKAKLKKINYQLEAIETCYKISSATETCYKISPATVAILDYKWNLEDLKEEIKNQISIIENTIKLKIKERDKWNSSKYQK